MSKKVQKPKIDLERIKALPKNPTKNLFEDFLYTSQSHQMPVFIKTAKNYKNNRKYSFCVEFIAVYRAVFMNMYRNRIKPEYDYQEICHLSFSEIGYHSRVCKDMVRKAISYGLIVGFIDQIPTKLKAKCKYKPGTFNYTTYPQN
jgi:hypothetical protein